MRNLKLGINRLIIIFFYTLGTIISCAQGNDTSWKQYLNTEEVGFSSRELGQVKTELDSMDTASLLVIYKGNILLSYGDITRKFMIHSIRKSIMNAMIGIEIENGTINLNQTLKELNIDDIGKLTNIEKEATIKDLISARSGIYHPSAYSTRGMIKNLPARGSHIPGSYWYYNNWDFNTLATIYEQQSGKNFFEAFKHEIANPIGMEDLKMEDTFYRVEKDKSIHPAYLLKMSARDMARFGLLYLNNGKWNEEQLILSDWIKKSTLPVSTELRDFGSRGAYGFLWWVSKMNNMRMYSAEGTGGHKIMIFPDDDLVIVHQVDTYINLSVNEEKISSIVSQIIRAKDGTLKTSSTPKLVNYYPVKQRIPNIYDGSMDQYLGTYTHRFLGEMTLKKVSDGYFLTNNVGKFELFATSDNAFYLADIQIPVIMIKTTIDEKKFTIEPKLSESNKIIEFIFYC